jgi:hypothetical protein
MRMLLNAVFTSIHSICCILDKPNEVSGCPLPSCVATTQATNGCSLPVRMVFQKRFRLPGSCTVDVSGGCNNGAVRAINFATRACNRAALFVRLIPLSFPCLTQVFVCITCPRTKPSLSLRCNACLPISRQLALACTFSCTLACASSCHRLHTLLPFACTLACAPRPACALPRTQHPRSAACIALPRLACSVCSSSHPPIADHHG